MNGHRNNNLFQGNRSNGNTNNYQWGGNKHITDGSINNAKYTGAVNWNTFSIILLTKEKVTDKHIHTSI